MTERKFMVIYAAVAIFVAVAGVVWLRCEGVHPHG